MSDPIIRARGLTKSYHDGERTLSVLTGVDLDLYPGEVVAITGQSGSGKSTLLNLLCALDKPTDGSVTISGEELTKMSGAAHNRLRRHRVGLVFQFHHLLQEFNAWENVAMPAMITGMPRAKAHERGMELLERVGLADRANHLPMKLSGGEQQRVAIARALVNDPAIVLADEPTGNLDEKTGSDVADLLWEVTRDGERSMIIVTHEMPIARRADRLLTLHKGILGTHG